MQPPTRPHDGRRPDNDLRVIRDRQAALDRGLDLLGRTGEPFKTARQLVKVYDGGSMGSSVPAYFLGNPVLLSGVEQEGGAASPVVDTSTSIVFVDLGPNPPNIGDIRDIHAVGGRWVTGYGCGVTFVVKCGSTLVSGATVTVKTGATVIASGTTNSSGQVSFGILAGTYTVTATGGTPDCSPGFNSSLFVACGSTHTLQCCGTHTCGSGGLACTLPSTLTLSWSAMCANIIGDGTCSPTSGSVPLTFSGTSYQSGCVYLQTCPIDDMGHTVDLYAMWTMACRTGTTYEVTVQVYSDSGCTMFGDSCTYTFSTFSCSPFMTTYTGSQLFCGLNILCFLNSLSVSA